jgi:hypothetical protein
MKTVIVVMCRNADSFKSGWITAIFEKEQDAYEYIRECQKADSIGRYSFWTEQWEVK